MSLLILRYNVPHSQAAKYRLLCPGQPCQPLGAYEGCNLALVPSHALMGLDSTKIGLTGPQVTAVKARLAALPASSVAKLHDGGDSAAPVFSSSTSTVADCEVNGECNSNFEKWFGANLLSAYQGVRQLTVTGNGAWDLRPVAMELVSMLFLTAVLAL